MAKFTCFIAIVSLFFMAESSSAASDTINFSIREAIYSNNDWFAEVVIDHFCSPGLCKMKIETEISGKEGIIVLRGAGGDAFTLYGLSDGNTYRTIIKINLVKLFAGQEIETVYNSKNWRLVK